MVSYFIQWVIDLFLSIFCSSNFLNFVDGGPFNLVPSSFDILQSFLEHFLGFSVSHLRLILYLSMTQLWVYVFLKEPSSSGEWYLQPRI